ncbi:hypothetical protein D7U95_02610 [Stenotrophomonas maltophilia]|nr:hypothetical protein [Stenotrophomonas maltophilia]
MCTPADDAAAPVVPAAGRQPRYVSRDHEVAGQRPALPSFFDRGEQQVLEIETEIGQVGNRLHAHLAYLAVRV